MHRFLVICLSAYWVVVFALGALGEAQPGGDPTKLPGLMEAAIAVASLLVCALFVWVATTAASSSEGAHSDASEIAGFAVGAAAAVLAARLAAGGAAEAGVAVPETAMQMAALGATLLVIRGTASAAPAVEPDHSPAVARRLAARAAHGSMLSRLSRRGPEATETEA